MANLLKKILGQRPKYVYKDRFKTREEAVLSAQNIRDYGSKSYDSRSVKNLKFDEKYTQGRSMIVPLILSTLDEGRYTILDIGGGVNAVFSHLNEVQKALHQCLVLERTEVTQSLNKKIPEKYNNHIHYISSIDNVKVIDIAYFGSSVQYIEDYEALLNRISTLSPQFIIFSESIFTNADEDYFVMQINMFPDVFPNRFLSEKKLIKLMKDLCYQCTYNKLVAGDFSHETIRRDSYDCKTLVFKHL